MTPYNPGGKMGVTVISLPKMAVYLALIASSLFGGALACEGTNLSAITDALTAAQVDWKDLADRLNVDPGRIEDIATECGNSAKRCRRGLVQAYCDSQVAEIKVIVENIAQALDKMGKKRHADSLREKFPFAGRVTPSSPPHVPHKSSNSLSEDEQPTQSQSGTDGQQTPPLPHNIANSLWKYLMAFSTGEIVLAVLSAVVIGLLITSRCQRKESVANFGARETTVFPPTDPMTEPIFDERVDLLRLSFIKYGEKELRVKKELNPHWQKLAPHLGFDVAEIETIKKNNHLQQDGATSDMFIRWITKDPDNSWRKLIEAMKKVELNVPAADLTKALRHCTN